jgi:hypothetical protein
VAEYAYRIRYRYRGVPNEEIKEWSAFLLAANADDAIDRFLKWYRRSWVGQKGLVSQSDTGQDEAIVLGAEALRVDEIIALPEP